MHLTLLMLMHSGTFVIVCIVSLIRWVRNDYQNQTPLTLTQTGLQRSYARTPRGNGEGVVEEGNGGGSIGRFALCISAHTSGWGGVG